MDRDALIATAERLLTLVKNKTTDMAPAVMEHPTSIYVDPDRFERECEVLFRQTPLLAGLACEIPDPGDWMTHDDSGVPILIARNKQGELRAFMNVCRHRGARLAAGPCGKARGGRMSCPYHAWTYDLDGRLVGIPYGEGFDGVDKATRGLVPLPVAERHGMIFVLADPDGTIDLDAHLGPLDGELAFWGLDKLTPLGTKTLHTDANWKLTLDTYTEGYHFSTLHPETIATTAYTNIMTYDRFGRHHRLGFPSKTITQLEDQPKEAWQPLQHFNFVYYLFPNTSFFVTDQTVEIFRICPGEAVNRSVTHHAFYAIPPLNSDAERQAMEETFAFIHHVVEHEDYVVTAGIQRGIDSGRTSSFVFGRNEPSLITMHRQYIEAVDDPPQRAAAE